ncbi:C40 family peptidase [Riemerella columbina]|uniref:C40 family peptidase n=1 Tax=Riemerella columbina TaxID=103810 RepID=UPI00266F2D3B|nr:C40 family peptidase [Riemerella columbina]WKS94710.1 C40 family peptidase [Riemerella columbina]
MKEIKNIIYLFCAVLVLHSCSTTKKTVGYKKTTSVKSKAAPQKPLYSSANTVAVSSKVKKLLKNAEKYLGTPYKYAGNTSSGFDCSGLVCKVFIENDTPLPRRSADQALEGRRVAVTEIQPGDLVFFATAGGAKVSHVGIVHGIAADGEITFIHSSTSKGVIISSLNEKYWNKAFLFARRVL